MRTTCTNDYRIALLFPELRVVLKPSQTTFGLRQSMLFRNGAENIKSVEIELIPGQSSAED
jgi:hypothetical protein